MLSAKHDLALMSKSSENTKIQLKLFERITDTYYCLIIKHSLGFFSL
jgi:hypothetical protein